MTPSHVGHGPRKGWHVGDRSHHPRPSGGQAGPNPRVRAAARNNAEWCDRVCRTHGLEGGFSADVWACARRTPPFFPDAVTLTAAATGKQVLELVDTSAPGCSIKDSFAGLDLSGDGFRVLFDAEWIQREAALPAPAPSGGLRWERVRDAAALESWEIAWSGEDTSRRLFRPPLLADENVVVLGGWVGGRVVAGAILSRSESVVGVSNVFSTRDRVDEAWSGCLNCAAERFPDLPAVGYESGEDLQAAHRSGFASLGHLCVWLAE